MRQRSPLLSFVPSACAGHPIDALSAGEVYRLFEHVMAISSRLPALDLSASEQRALAGRIFEEAPLFTSRVSRTLRTRAELFDDVAVGPDEIDLLQRRALAWECLQNGLLWLARLAGALYIRDQASAVASAIAVVDQVRGDEARPFPHARHAERRAALGQAEQVLAERQDRKRRRAGQAKKEESGGPSGRARPERAPAGQRRVPLVQAAARAHRRRVEAWLARAEEDGSVPEDPAGRRKASRAASKADRAPERGGPRALRTGAQGPAEGGA